MSDNQKKKANLGLILGPLGVIAGIVLIFSGNWLLGIAGTIASAGVAYQGYKNSKLPKD